MKFTKPGRYTFSNSMFDVVMFGSDSVVPVFSAIVEPIALSTASFELLGDNVLSAFSSWVVTSESVVVSPALNDTELVVLSSECIRVSVASVVESELRETVVPDDVTLPICVVIRFRDDVMFLSIGGTVVLKAGVLKADAVAFVSCSVLFRVVVVVVFCCVMF